jgi:hypothetical protein
MPYLETLFWKLAIRIIKRRYSFKVGNLEMYEIEADERAVKWIENHIKRINTKS